MKDPKKESDLTSKQCIVRKRKKRKEAETVSKQAVKQAEEAVKKQRLLEAQLTMVQSLRHATPYHDTRHARAMVAQQQQQVKVYNKE